MDERRKQAYRYLLYKAMLDIRQISWLPLKWYSPFSPMFWVRNIPRVRRAGEIADWLHNLAFFSMLDFEGFGEDWFWQDYQRLCERYPLPEYRRLFDQHLKESML